MKRTIIIDDIVDGKQIKHKLNVRSQSDLSFSEYNELVKIYNNIYDNVDEFYKDLLRLFTTINEDLLSRIKQFDIIDFDSLMNEGLETYEKDKNGKFKKYILKDNSKIKFRRFMDLEELIKQDVDMQNIVALLLLPDNFEMEEYKKLILDVEKNMRASQGIYIYNEFYLFYKQFYENYSGMWSNNNKDENLNYEGEDIDFTPEMIAEMEAEEKAKEEQEKKDKENNIGLVYYIHKLSFGKIWRYEELKDYELLTLFNFLAEEYKINLSQKS